MTNGSTTNWSTYEEAVMTDWNPHPLSNSPKMFSPGDRPHDPLLERVARHCLPARPPQDLVDLVGGGDYYRKGLATTFIVIALSDMRPHHRVLEPGCGCGRNARIMAPLLGPDGSYSGFDISERSIAWCRESISSLYHNTRFDHADVKNTIYNPVGSILPEEFIFPYEDECFDITFLHSVFTHMTKDGLEHYLSEIHRVTKPGGRVVSSFFLLNPAIEQPRIGDDDLVPYDDVSHVIETSRPDNAIAYSSGYVMETFASKGYEVNAVMKGSWSGLRPTGLMDYQDRILCTRLPKRRSVWLPRMGRFFSGRSGGTPRPREVDGRRRPEDVGRGAPMTQGDIRH